MIIWINVALKIQLKLAADNFGSIVLVMSSNNQDISLLLIFCLLITDNLIKELPLTMRSLHNLQSQHEKSIYFNNYLSFIILMLVQNAMKSNNQEIGLLLLPINLLLTVMSPHSDYMQRKCVAACCVSQFYAF